MMKIMKNHKINASQVATEFLDQSDLKIHSQTIRRNTKKSGYSSRTARRKLIVNER